jgi:hypothetical protein
MINEVQFCGFDALALDGEHLRALPLSLRKTNLARLLRPPPRRHLCRAIRARRDRSRSIPGSLLRTVRAGMLAVPSRVSQRLPGFTAHDVSEIDQDIRAASWMCIRQW